MKYRDKLKIIATIIKAVETESKKTHIMYRANLSSKMLKKYLQILLNSGLISKINKRYEITKTGQVFLERYDEFTDKNYRIEDKINDLSLRKDLLEKMIT